MKSSTLVLFANNALPGGCVRELRHTERKIELGGGGREITLGLEAFEGRVHLTQRDLGERVKKDNECQHFLSPADLIR